MTRTVYVPHSCSLKISYFIAYLSTGNQENFFYVNSQNNILIYSCVSIMLKKTDRKLVYKVMRKLRLFLKSLDNMFLMICL